MKKARIYLLLLMLSVVFTLTGCSDENDSPGTINRIGDLAGNVEKAVNNTVGNREESGAWDYNYDEPLTGTVEYVYEDDYSLEDLAALNNMEVDDLNQLFLDEDCLLFLGNKYGDDIVKNPEDALNSLRHVYSLVGLDGINLEYNRTDVSPVSGNVVYTFYQTGGMNIDGEYVVARFYNSLIKVITDKDGNLEGVSANIVPNQEMSDVDLSEIVSMDEAIAYVKRIVKDPNCKVYEDEVQYIFWEDEGTVSRVSDSKITPAWLIYADSSDKDKDGKPYTAYVVAFAPQVLFDSEDSDEYSLQPAVIAKYYTETRSESEYDGVYTSEAFFEPMEDAGDYSYEVSLDWVKKINPAYKGKMKQSFTVPVMYSSKEDLYYLGSKPNKITLSNDYDFEYLDKTNPYVTTNPNDLKSWHFKYDKASDGSTGKYFDDPNYVVSSFSVMCDVWDMFYNRYGLDSVDGTGLPTLLNVYMVGSGYYDEDGEIVEEVTYPKRVEDFDVNMVNLGQCNDWQVMCTSPAYPSCLDRGGMGHEYTHGINGQLTLSQYLNGPGAVMESYADIVGTQIAMVNQCPENINGYEWLIDGMYSPTIRSMKEPELYRQPRYYNGNYFVNDVDSSVASSLDEGGVHTNSGILNYLAYLLVNGTGGKITDHPLTIEENLDMWFDTLYYTNYQSDYFDVACYLQFAAKSMKLPEEKQQYVKELLKNFGFLFDETFEENDFLEEEGTAYGVKLEYATDEYDDLDEVFAFGVSFVDENGECYDAGGFDAEGELIYSVGKDVKIVSTDIEIGDMTTGESIVGFSLDENYNVPRYSEIYFEVCELPLCQQMSTEAGYEVVNCVSDNDYYINESKNGAVTFSAADEGAYVLALRNLSDDDNHGNYRIVFVVAYDDGSCYGGNYSYDGYNYSDSDCADGSCYGDNYSYDDYYYSDSDCADGSCYDYYFPLDFFEDDFYYYDY